MLNAKLTINTQTGIHRYNFNAYAKNLIAGEVDLLAGGWSQVYGRYKLAGGVSTGVTFKDGYKIISIEPLKGIQPLKALVMPFDIYIWSFLVGAIPISGVTLYLLRRFSNVPDKEANIWDSLWDVTVITCWDGIRSPHPSAPIIFHLSAYMMVFYLLISLYQGYYVAGLIVPKYIEPPIDTTQQLWEETTKKWVAGLPYHIDLWNNYFESIAEANERVH